MKKAILMTMMAVSAFAQHDLPPQGEIKPPKQNVKPPVTPPTPQAAQQANGIPQMSKEDSDAVLAYAYLIDEIRLAQIQLESQLTSKYKATGYSIQKIGMAQFGFVPIVQSAPPTTPVATAPVAPPAK